MERVDKSGLAELPPVAADPSSVTTFILVERQ